MPRASLPRLIVLTLVLGGSAPPVAARAQDRAAATLGQEQLTTFAKAYVAIGLVRDQIHAELAQTRNKTPQAQQELQAKMRQQIEHVLHEHGLTDAEYQRRTYLVSVEPETRKTFDEIVAQLTGQPAPGQQPSPPPAATAPRPARAGESADGTRTHVDHIMTAFGDTPDRQGLLPIALAEARIAAQHAALAARNTADLATMQLHAGHILHAVDASAVASGPGRGYGVKKAALAVAAHIELAARAQGAAQNVTTHAMHIATSARNTVQRADRIVVLAKQIQAASTAEEAAALLNQLVPLTEQLISGADTNADGRITWQDGEGGLHHVEEHLNLLLRADADD